MLKLEGLSKRPKHIHHGYIPYSKGITGIRYFNLDSYDKVYLLPVSL